MTLDFSAAGLLGMYLMLADSVPAVQAIPMWIVLLLIFVGMVGRGVYNALKDDGRISIDEAKAIFGIVKSDGEILLAAAEVKPSTVDTKSAP